MDSKKDKKVQRSNVGNKKKLYRRVGAGFLALLSLVGVGSAVSGRIAKTPKPMKGVSGSKAKRQVETVQQEQTSEVQEDIQQEMQKLSLKQQQAQEQRSVTSLVTMVAAYATWVGAMGIFVSSLFFNQPFPLGYGLMALLPGEPHTVDLILESEAEEVQINETFEVDLIINTGFAVVSSMKADFDFDPDVFQVEEIKYTDSFFPTTEKNYYDNEAGVINIVRSFGEEKKIQSAENEKVATVVLRGQPSLGQGYFSLLKRATHPGIESVGCWVYGESGTSNLIAEVGSISFDIKPLSNKRSVSEIVDITQAIEIDGDLLDWDPDALDYIGFSREEKDDSITYMDTIGGKSSSENDINFSFSVGQQDNFIYIAANITDDSLTEKDKVEIHLKDQDELLPFGDLENGGGMVSVSEIEEGAYLFEAKIKIEGDDSNLQEDLNLTVYDHDEDGSWSINKFSH